MTAVWAAVLLAAVWTAYWGAERLSGPLKKLRKQWGFSVAAGGSFLGIAAASPEIGINVTSAARGVSDIGLGAMLGSNVLAIPLMVATAYVATRKSGLKESGNKDHQEHRRKHYVAVDKGAVTVQAFEPPVLGEPQSRSSAGGVEPEPIVVMVEEERMSCSSSVVHLSSPRREAP